MSGSTLRLSDDDLGAVLRAKGEKLEAGHKDRSEAVRELVQLLAAEDDVMVAKSDELISSGRASFGAANEGRPGTALFLPDEPSDD